MGQQAITPFSMPTEAIETVIASDGVKLPIASLAQTLGYTSGVVTSITVTYGGNTYVQTLSYTTGNLTGVSVWVKQ